MPAELDQLADILDQDASTGMGGFRNLNDGQVVPGALLDDIPELADGIEPGNWIYARAEGVRAAELFAEQQEARLRRRLLAAIEARGAFRRLRDVIHDEPQHTGEASHQFGPERAAVRAVEWLAGEGYDVAPRVRG